MVSWVFMQWSMSRCHVANLHAHSLHWRLFSRCSPQTCAKRFVTFGLKVAPLKLRNFLRVDGCMHAVVFSLYTQRVDGNSWRSIARIALKPEIGSLAQIKNVISLVAGICKHGVDLARCGENLALFF